MKKRICKICGKENVKKIIKGKCDCCYQKTEVTHFSMGNRMINVYTNGVTEEIKPLIPQIKEDTLNNIIKNPRRILDEIKLKTTDSKES